VANILDKHVLKNGMVVLGEPMPGVGSVAFDFLVPCGAATLPVGRSGAAAVIQDWIFRGAGDRNSRQLVDALDGLGLHRSTSVSTHHLALGAALEASNLAAALELYADVILRPKLDVAQFDLSRQLAIHDIVGLDDDPRQKVMIRLYEQFYPDPFGRPGIGKLEDLESLTPLNTADIIDASFHPGRMIFSIAGKYDFEAVCRQIERLFDMPAENPAAELKRGMAGPAYVHVPHAGAQVHIGLMTKAPSINSDRYYDINVAVSVLSGGMSSRLFTEVREKRGLCYAVGARYSTLKDMAGISCYAGTTPEKAQETIDVIRAEFGRLWQGITPDEIDRAKVGLESSLIMQSESSSARASGIASDYFLLGRVRSLDEIKQKLEAASVQSVTGCLAENRFKDYTLVTVGPREIAWQ